MSLQSALISILNGKRDYCCLCFKSVRDEALFMSDEVAVQGLEKTLNFYEILSPVIGTNILNTLSETDPICEFCKTTAVNSYNFIKMCTRNCQSLYYGVSSIETRLETCNKAVGCKSLFVTLDTTNFTCNKYYDCKRAPIDRSTAFKRLELLINNDSEPTLNCEDFQEYYKVEIDHDIGNGKSINYNKKSKRQKAAKQILTTDLINNGSKTQCKFCLREFKTTRLLRGHYFRIHAEKSFKCKKCPRRYGHQSLLSEHLIDCHTSVVCSECGKTYNNKGSLRQHELGHKVKVMCQYCGKSYKTPKTLRIHLCQAQTDNVAQFFSCDHCGKKYGRKGTLTNHIKYEHMKIRVATCAWCNKKFSSESHLKAHIVTHTQTKSFPCELCGGRFVSKASLLYHTRTHTGEKPFPCELCDRRFLSKSRRTEHMRRRHRGPTIKCGICESKFKSSGDLRRHEIRHYNPKSKLYCPNGSGDNCKKDMVELN